jgi:hypothetical protein
MQTATIPNIPGASTTAVNNALGQAAGAANQAIASANQALSGTAAGSNPAVQNALNQASAAIGNLNVTGAGQPPQGGQTGQAGTTGQPQQGQTTGTGQQPQQGQTGTTGSSGQPQQPQQGQTTGGATSSGQGQPTQGSQQQAPQGQGSMAGCLPPMPDDLVKSLATMLTQTDFLGVLSDLTCTTTLPVECDITTAPATYGADWLNNCGQWVVVNINDGGEAVNTDNLVNLCAIVTASNALGSTRRYMASGASVATMPTSSDVTLSDPKIVVNTAVISSTTADVQVANSTATTSVGYSAAALEKLNNTAITQLKGSGFRATISVLVLAFLSVFLF